MGSTSRSKRLLRGGAAAALIAGSLALLGATPARALGSGVFLACGDYDTAATATGSGCESLSDALSDALTFGNQFASSATVDLMPGGYCPPTLPVDSRGLTLMGVGAAGLADPTTFSGPEAALTTFGWNATCSGSAPTYELTTPDHGSQLEGGLDLENLAVDGSAAGAPANGIFSNNAGLQLRDVLAQNFGSGAGLTFTASGAFVSQQLAQMDVENSAFLDNQTGVNFAVEGSIDESTIADNTGTGLLVSGDMHLDNDTISHNATGIAPVSQSTVQMDNSTVGDNTTDCSTTSGIEPGGVNGGNGTNLLTSSCATSDNTDLTLDPDTVADVGLNGGPTPSILPPSQADGAAASSLCNSTGTDQREYIGATTFAPCDIGSVNTDSSNGTAVPATGESSLDFGPVPTDQQEDLRLDIENNGGGMLGISGLTLTGDSAFSLVSDPCTYFLLLHTEGAGDCVLYVQAAPTTQTDATGQLAVHTTSGEIDVPLTVTGAPPVGSPSGVTGTSENHRVALSWLPAPGGGQTINGYAVQASDDNGLTWEEDGGSSFPDTSTTITGLSNGKHYIFEVAVEDAFGNGQWSLPSDPITPLPPPHSSALTAPAAATINEGGKITLSTTLTDTNSSTPISGATVSLVASPGGTVHATTGSTGVATVSVHPTRNTRYHWAFAGSSGHASASTPTVQVSVKQVVHATLSVKKIKHGKTVTITGTVSPKETGDVVVSTRYRPGNNKTTRIKLKPGGAGLVRFSYKYTPPKKGTVTIEVTRAATATNAGGASKPLKLKVT